MGSEDSESAPASGFKRRRLQGACDACRQRKVRCDSAQMPGRVCTNCKAFNSLCTHEASDRRGSAYRGITDAQSITSLVSDILSESKRHELPRNPALIRQQFSQLAQYARSLEHQLSLQRGSHSGTSPSQSRETSDCPDSSRSSPPAAETLEGDASDSDQAELSEELKRLVLTSSQNRFHGKSSNIMLVKDALDVKDHFGVGGNTFGAQREEFWVHNSWQIHPPASPPIQIFPPPDLLSDLISLFFTHAQPCTLILHRPTFERLVAAGLHFKDHRFGNLVLAVCAVGSISSDDPRVLFPGSSSKHSRGWQWLKQINFYQNIFNGPMFGLHDIQAICLFLTFFFGSSNQDTSWVLLGLAIRSAQDIGVHRYKFRSRKPTVEEESWKRAFWILFCIDLGFSRTLGRPIATTFEDFDLDMPIECDDEYWENPDPELCFKQPAGKPSYITGLVKYIQLMEILAYVLRHLYCVRRSSLGPRVASQSDGRLVADLDSALNRWIDTVPGHLRWNPQMEDELWFAQSVMLYANYYHLQILVHRPFIPPPGQTSPLAFPSLAICANAARSCSRVVRAHTKRSFFPLPHLLDAAFTSAVILLLNIWGGRSSGISLDPVKEMEDVNKCFAFLRSQENRFLNAGQLCDIINELASANDLPKPREASLKRRQSAQPDDYDSASYVASGAAHQAQHEPLAPATLDELDRFLQLPMYASQLGQLPIHASTDTPPPGLLVDPAQPAPSLNPSDSSVGVSDYTPIEQAFLPHMAQSETNLFSGNMLNAFGPTPEWYTWDTLYFPNSMT